MFHLDFHHRWSLLRYLHVQHLIMNRIMIFEPAKSLVRHFHQLCLVSMGRSDVPFNRGTRPCAYSPSQRTSRNAVLRCVSWRSNDKSSTQCTLIYMVRAKRELLTLSLNFSFRYSDGSRSRSRSDHTPRPKAPSKWGLS